MEADAVRRARARDRVVAEGLVLAPDSGPTDTRAALDQATASLYAEVSALGPSDESAACPMPHGDPPVSTALDIFVFEAGIHASDFADAVGDDRPLAGDVVPATVRVLSSLLPVLAGLSTVDPPVGSSFSLRGETVRLDGTWSDAGLHMLANGQEPTLTVSGDDSSVLLYAVGRLGADDPRLVVTGAAELAAEFKTYVPGP
jgi:hypothetical protein